MTHKEYLSELQHRIETGNYAKNAILTLLETSEIPTIYMASLYDNMVHLTGCPVLAKKIQALYRTFHRGSELFEFAFLHIIKEGLATC